MKKNILFLLFLIISSAFIFCEEILPIDQAKTVKQGYGFHSESFNAKYVINPTEDSEKKSEEVGDNKNYLESMLLFLNNFEEIKEYPITPGDVFSLVVINQINYTNFSGEGNSGSSYNIQLDEDYILNIPLLGKINAKGKNIFELEAMISDSIKRVMPVQIVKFRLSSPAIFNVFIFGGVKIPGPIQATPLTTLTQALTDSGGFSSHASYRNVLIKRNNEILHVDISKYYNEADKESNPKLKPGDEIYIPMPEKMVSISGAIQFPGKYELLEGEGIDALLKMSNNPKNNNKIQEIKVTRIEKDGKLEKIVVDTSTNTDFSLENGDILEVLFPYHNSDTITVEGALYGKKMLNQNPFSAPTSSIKLEIPYYPGISLLSVLDDFGGPTPYAKTELTEIIREEQGETVSIDIEPLWKTRNPKLDVELNPSDYIYIPIEENFVAAFGALIDDGTSNILPHRTGYTVMDYLIRCGGVDYQTADTNNIQLVAKDGSRKKIKLTDTVPPGSVIYVSKNVLRSINDGWSNALIITGIITGITTFVTTVVSFAFSVQDWVTP